MLRLSGTCVLARLACPPSQEIQQHLTKISKIKREKKEEEEDTHQLQRIRCSGAVKLTFLKTTFLLFISVVSLLLTTQQIVLKPTFFVIFGFNYHSILISINHQENQEDGTSFQKIIDHKIFLNITLLFANFELHCDSYTFSLRLNLKQLKLEKILILNLSR